MPQFRYDIPDEFRQMAESEFSGWEMCLPGWCHHVNIMYRPSDPDSNLMISVEPDYRWATLYICPHFLTADRQQREENKFHEIIHIHVEPLAEFAKDVIRRYVSDNGLKDYVLDDLRRRLESVVCDLSLTFYPMVKQWRDSLAAESS